jgi:glycosyltransferase involved in cell wall biosynthesis
MKVAVLNNAVPFLRGGAEHLSDALVSHLERRGHDAVAFNVPFRWDSPAAILESAYACFSLRVPNVDRVIALKFPAYYVPHGDKVLWLLHQFRQVYDLWGTPLQDVPDSATGLRLREAIHRADEAVLARCRIHTNSAVTSQRLRDFNGIASSVLFPPLLDDAHFRCESFGEYLFYPSRINNAKRQLLAIEAMAHVQTGVRLVVAGAVEAPPDETEIRAFIERLGVADKVTFLPGFMDEMEKADLFARALGCVYIPYDEDSYGYVTLESYASRKPVVTASDSGGTSVVVVDGETGFVTEPTPQALAEAFDALYADREGARTMGDAGAELVQSLGITWDNVVETLLA